MKGKYKYKIFEIQISAVDFYEKWEDLIKELNSGWEIVLHREDSFDIRFILRIEREKLKNDKLN